MLRLIKKNWHLLAILLMIFCFPVFPLKAEVIDIMPPGTIEGEGNSFKITDSVYLNVGLQSSEPVKIRMESIPEIIMITLQSASLAKSAEITLSNLTPSTTYYKYQDNYHNLESFATDKNGNYTYSQNLSVPHFIFIQTRKSTKFIKDDATGGDCTSIGVWDTSAKTCTLNTDLNETIQIDSDNVILDGNDYEISGYNTGSGVYVYSKKNITLKNLRVKNFGNGIFLYGATDNNLSDNVVSYNSIGINIYSASNNFLKSNTAIYNGNFGLFIMGSSANNILRNNSMFNNRLPMHGDGYDFYIRSFNYSAFGNDINTTNTADGKPIYYVENINNQTYENLGNIGLFYCIKCNNITFKNFTINSSNNETGLYLWQTNNSGIEDLNIDKSGIGIRIQHSYNNIFKNNIVNNTLAGVLISGSSSGNLLYHNNFINNRRHLWFVGSGSNSFNADLPLGGNYWDDFDTPAEGCSDANNDNICDSPYIFSGGQDNYPWIKQDGWVVEKPLSGKAAYLAKLVINAPYLGDGSTYGGKGWDPLQNFYVSYGEIFNGYNYWNNKLRVNAFGAGLDCSGLVQWAFNRSFDPNKSLLHNAIRYDGADGQYKNNTEAIVENDLRPGDLLFLDKTGDNHIDHVAMYVGDNEDYDIVEAFNPRRGIISSIKDEFKVRVGFNENNSLRRVVVGPSIGGQVKAGSPIDLIITDPDGFTITPTTTIQTDEEYLNEISGQLYYTENVLGTDGHPEDIVYWPVQKTGNYIIKVVPENGAAPTETYSLEFQTGDKNITLAENIPLNQTPSNGYGVTVANDQTVNTFIPVSIDIKPGSFPNSINLGSKGVVPVAIFGSANLDVKQIDVDSIKLGSASVKIKGNGQSAISYSDVNKDGFIDIVVNMSTEELQLTPNDTEANLEGQLINGDIIKSSDSVRIIPKL